MAFPVARRPAPRVIPNRRDKAVPRAGPIVLVKCVSRRNHGRHRTYIFLQFWGLINCIAGLKIRCCCNLVRVSAYLLGSVLTYARLVEGVPHSLHNFLKTGKKFLSGPTCYCLNRFRRDYQVSFTTYGRKARSIGSRQ
jgi:hypothetical protein